MSQAALSLISSKAKIGNNVVIGNYCVIEDNVTIGDDCILENNVTIKANTKIGTNNHLFPGVVLGAEPQDLSQRNVASQLIIGDHNVFRENVTVHRGSNKQNLQTTIGSHGYFMVNAHIGHDCQVADHVIITNNASLGGHVTVDHHAIIGANCAIHQYCHVGAYAMLSYAAMVNKDILPYVMVVGNKPRVVGLNKIGLQRNGFTDSQIKQLLRAYKIIFRQGNTAVEAITQLTPMVDECQPIQSLIDGLQQSNRGIIR